MTPLRVTHVWAYFGTLFERAIAEEIYGLVRAGVDARIVSFNASVTPSDSATDEALRSRTRFLDRAIRGGPAAFGALNVLAELPGMIRHPWTAEPGHGLAVAGGSAGALRWARGSGRRAALARELRRDPPDVLHAQHAHLAWWALPAARRLGLPMMVSVRGLDLALVQELAGDRFEELLRIPTRFLTRCEYMARELIEIGAPEDRVFVHPSGIRTENIPFRERVPPAPDEPVVFLAVGRLVEKKGMADAVSAFASSGQACERGSLRILGSGPEEETLRRLVRHLGLDSRVTFLGHCPQSDVWEEMSRAHVLVLASHRGAGRDREGVPNAIKEGAASGLPIISTRHGGIPEVFEHGVHGLLAPAGDIEKLAECFDEMALHPERWAEMGRRGREMIVEGHSVSRLTPRLIEHYRALLAEAGS